MAIGPSGFASVVDQSSKKGHGSTKRQSMLNKEKELAQVK
jgi:hypothetical protein